MYPLHRQDICLAHFKRSIFSKFWTFAFLLLIHRTLSEQSTLWDVTKGTHVTREIKMLAKCSSERVKEIFIHGDLQILVVNWTSKNNILVHINMGPQILSFHVMVLLTCRNLTMCLESTTSRHTYNAGLNVKLSTAQQWHILLLLTHCMQTKQCNRWR
jgi:hypothetical protein